MVILYEVCIEGNRLSFVGRFVHSYNYESVTLFSACDCACMECVSRV